MNHLNFIKNLVQLLEKVKASAFLALVILVFKGLTVGAGLLLIVPLLEVAGLSHSDASNSQLIQFVSQVFEGTSLSFSLVNVLAIYFVFMCFYAAVNYGQGLLTAQINKRIVDRWRIVLFERLTYASWASIQKIKGSDLQALLTNDIKRFASISNQTIQLLGTIILITTYLVISLLLSVQLTFLSLIPLGILVLLSRPINRKTYRLGEDTVKHNKAMQSSITEHLGAIKLVKTYQKEKAHLKEFQDKSSATEKQLIVFTKASGRTKLLFEVLAAAVIVAYIFIALSLFHLQVSELLLLIFIFARLLPRVSKLVGAYQQIIHNLPSFEATKTIIDALKQEEGPAGKPASLKFDKELRFESVSFSYTNKEIIRDFNCSIPANKTTIILGRSGVGKSTMIDLVLGLHQPKSGQISVDGIPLRSINQKEWRAQVAVVPQDAFLFNRSILENVRWSNPDAEDYEIEMALKQAGAFEFIQQLPEGLKTMAGDRGMRLSGGERQRIALARALLRKPQILILDEATNAVDDIHEEIIYNAIRDLKGKMTIIIVAHRSKLLDLADVHIRL